MSPVALPTPVSVTSTRSDVGRGGQMVSLSLSNGLTVQCVHTPPSHMVVGDMQDTGVMDLLLVKLEVRVSTLLACACDED
jgi:hypothetical protein